MHYARCYAVLSCGMNTFQHHEQLLGLRAPQTHHEVVVPCIEHIVYIASSVDYVRLFICRERGALLCFYCYLPEQMRGLALPCVITREVTPSLESPKRTLVSTCHIIEE